MAQNETQSVRPPPPKLAQFEPKSLALTDRNHWHNSNRNSQEYERSARPSEYSMLNYIRATGFAGYVLNDCFGYFSGDIIERSLKALQVFMLLEAILPRFAQDNKC